jgi:signal transduction histidine kinase
VRTPDPAARADAALAAAASALVGALLVAFSEGHRVSVAAVSAAVLAGCLVGLRWRLPTVVLLPWLYGPPVAALLQERGEGVVFLLVVALSYLVLLEDDVRLRVAAGVLAVAVPGAVQLVVRADWGWPFWTGGLLVTWLSAEQLRRFRALVAELEATRERLAEQAVHLERRRIAAELHDLVGHSLGVLLLHVTGARRRIADDPAAAAEALRRAESIGRAGLAEIRRSVAALRDETGTSLAPATTAADVPALVAATAAAGCAATLAVSGSLVEVEPITGLAVYRVVQESLANAARHAPGAAVRVAVAVGAAEVEVTVANTGAGTRPRGPGGVGLVGMRERVEALGGTLTAGPTGAGWTVRAVLPRAAPGPPAAGPAAPAPPAAGPAPAPPAAGPAAAPAPPAVDAGADAAAAAGGDGGSG